MPKNTLLHILLLISLIILPACGREPDFGYGPTEDLSTSPAQSDQPTQEPTDTPVPIPTAWLFEPESLAIRLSALIEKGDGSLEFWVYVLNPNPGLISDCVVSVVLYGSEEDQLLDNQESCGEIEAYAEAWVIVEFDESFIPEEYQTYNIFAQAAAPGEVVLKGELNDLPLSGQEGVEISKNRVLPHFSLELEWILPGGDYQPGDQIQVQLTARLLEGSPTESSLCLEVVEFRSSVTDQAAPFKLAESCESLAWEPGEEIQTIDLGFEPSGFTWIQLEDDGKEYIPLEITARGEVLLRGASLAELDKDLFLAPVEVESASWSAGGEEVGSVQPETPYQIDLKLRSLADDPRTHSIQLSIRYTEHDPEEWLVSGLLLFLPCLFGFCEDEAVVFTQEDQITLLEGAEYLYSLPVQLPEGPTGEEGFAGYYYLALSFDGVTIWRGEKVPLKMID